MNASASIPWASDHIKAVRKEFPILHQEVHGHPLVYFDNAATSQKPRPVLDAILYFYQHDNANVHRGIHALSERSTSAYEGARVRAARFLGASSPREVVFTRGTTEGINLLAHSLGSTLQPGNRILLTEMEHHSNMVPWQIVAERTGAVIDYIPVIAETGCLDLEAARRLFERRPAIFSCTHISNTLGTVNPVAMLCAWARDAGTLSIVDAAQSAGHRLVSLATIGCDFLVCSGHKMCGPMGIGLLIGREEMLEKMPPWQGGGEMIAKVSYEGSTWNDIPFKFEAGTPNVEGAIALAAAMDYLDHLGREDIHQRDLHLVRVAWERLHTIPGLQCFGPPPGHPEHAGVLSFKLAEAHAHDVVSLANDRGVALRGGHHCNQPLMKKLGVPATARASFYFYNTEEEIEILACALEEISRMFR
jgi:cysteine desulfurase/selenocysteine lyase